MTREEAINYLKSSGVKIRMTRTEAINYLKSSGMSDKQIETVINALTCEDCISRTDAMDMILCYGNEIKAEVMDDIKASMIKLPSVTPKFTDAEIQKMQDLEQTQLEKAYELGKAEVKPCEDCISRKEAEAIFKNARKSLYELSRKEQVKDFQTREMMLLNAEQFIHLLPSVKPKFTDEEILKMQELEQAHLDKAYELGKAEMQPSEDCISREEALKHSHIEYDDDGIGHRVVYVEDLEELPTVTPKESED